MLLKIFISAVCSLFLLSKITITENKGKLLPGVEFLSSFFYLGSEFCQIFPPRGGKFDYIKQIPQVKKQSETVKNCKKKSKEIDLESCPEAERRYEPVAAGKPGPNSINTDPELKNFPPSQLSQPSRSKSNKAKIFVAGDAVVKDVKGLL